jgi:transposase
MATTKVRVRRSTAEKRRIVELTYQPGQSVARVAQAEGVNSHQVFQWRRAYKLGALSETSEQAPSLLPVIVATTEPPIHLEPHEEMGLVPTASSGAIHIELPGRAMISVECGADPATLRVVLESLRK